jgi:hypothetical protein
MLPRSGYVTVRACRRQGTLSRTLTYAFCDTLSPERTLKMLLRKS